MQALSERRTIDVPDAAHQLGISTWVAYDEIRRTGCLAGIPVIRVSRRVLIPREPLERLLSGGFMVGDVSEAA